MKYIEFPPEASAFHGSQYPLGPIETPYQEHSDKIRVGPVCVQVGSRLEAANLHRVHQSMIFLVDHVDISKTEEEEMHDFTGYPHVAQGVKESENGRSAEKGENRQYYGIRFYGDQEGIKHPFPVNVQRAKRPNDLSGKRERKEEPKKHYEAIHHRQPNQNLFRVETGSDHQKNRKDQCKS